MGFTYRQSIDIPKQICLGVRWIRSAIQLYQFPGGILVLVPFNIGITFRHGWNMKRMGLVGKNIQIPLQQRLKYFGSLHTYNLQNRKDFWRKFLLLHDACERICAISHSFPIQYFIKLTKLEKVVKRVELINQKITVNNTWIQPRRSSLISCDFYWNAR